MVIGQEQSLEQQLFSALENHNAGALAGLLLAGADPNAKNELGQTAVEYAFQAKCPDEMRVMLLEGGANLQPVVEWIAWAAESAPAEVLHGFLKAGADPNLSSANGRPLQIAARLGRHESVEVLLRGGADPDAGTDAGNPLAEAIEHGHSRCAISLLAGGARPEQADRTRSALGAAALHGMTDVARALVAAGAPVDTKVTLVKDHEVLDELSQAFDELFHAASAQPEQRPITKTPPTIRYANATPLVIAAAEGHEATVRCLVDRGADLEATDDSLQTAFQRAKARGHTSVVVALLDAGANPNPVLPAPLLLLAAAEKGDAVRVRALVAQDADIGTRDTRLCTEGQTALMLAAAHGHEAVVDVLLEASAEVDATTPVDLMDDATGAMPAKVAGRTALMAASAQGHHRVVARLLQAGAASELRDATGRTARDLATEAGHAEVIELLGSTRDRPEPEETAPARHEKGATRKTAAKKKSAGKTAKKKAKKKSAKKKTARKTAKKKGTGRKKASGKKKPVKKKKKAATRKKSRSR